MKGKSIEKIKIYMRLIKILVMRKLEVSIKNLKRSKLSLNKVEGIYIK